MKANKSACVLIPASMLITGLASAAPITFEADQGYTLGIIGALNGGVANTNNAPFTGQQDWSLSTSSGRGSIITTTTSGEYTAGRALAADTGGNLTYVGGKKGIIETAVTNTISFDLRFENNVSVTAGYFSGNLNDLFNPNTDSGMQFGVNANAVYARNALFGSNVTLAGITNSTLTVGRWYGFDITIGEVLGGNRSISMSVRDLTNSTTLDLNGATAGTAYMFSATEAAFGVAPEDAIGGFVRVTQVGGGSLSAIDNIAFTAVPEPGSLALLGIGGLLVGARWFKCRNFRGPTASYRSH